MSTKLSRRDMLKLGALATAGAALAACQPGAGAKVEETAPAEVTKAEGNVVVMHFRHEFTEDEMNAFMAENPGITLEFVDGTDLTRFYAMYAAGTPPDLVRVQAPSIPQFLARKLLFDLTPYFESSTVLKMDDLMPANNAYKAESPLKIGTGKIYGMVKDFSPDSTLYAFKPAFEEAGITLDDTKSYSYAEVREMAKKVMKTEGDRILFFGFGNETGWYDRYWMVMLSEVGQSLYSEGYEKIILADNEETKKILKFFFDLAKDKINYSPLNPSPAGWMGTDFTAGQLGFIQYGFWYSAMAESDTTKGKVMMLPSPNWAGVHKDPTITATGMIMTAASKVPDAAWKTFEYYNGGAPAVARAKSGWGVPGLKSMLNLIPQETEFQKQANKVLQGELALNDEAVQFNPFLGETQVPNAFNKYLEIALKGDITFDEMLKSVEDEVNAAIKDGISAIMG